MRISVSRSRPALVVFPASSSSRSAVHRPSFGSGWTSRSYSKDVSPDRSTLRTVFRDTLRSREICLIVLPLTKCSRRIRPIVSTVSIPPPPASNQSEQRIRPSWRGSILDADNPHQGVKIARRNTIKDFGVHDMGDPRGSSRTPIDIVEQYLHKDFNETGVACVSKPRRAFHH